jgi:hypothetical protein
MKVKYYQTAAGQSPVEAFVRGAPFNVQEQFYDAVKRLVEGQILPMPLSRSLAGVLRGLHELRLKDSTGAYRIFY